MTTPSTPAPCGHCGGDGPRPIIVRHASDYFVECEKCWAEGPKCATPAEALAAWNTRPREEALREELRRIAELARVSGWTVLAAIAQKAADR
jgi:hypothetical protein